MSLPQVPLVIFNVISIQKLQEFVFEGPFRGKISIQTIRCTEAQPRSLPLPVDLKYWVAVWPFIHTAASAR